MKDSSENAVGPAAKRRRSAAVGNAASESKSDVGPPDVWAMEEAEANNRDPEKDQQLFKQACGNIKRVMKEVLELKKQKNSSAEIAERRVQASLLFLTMKKLNRLEKIRNRKAKQKVDMHHLQLQNLLYEVTHLTKEVNKCLEFKSKDEEIELVTVEDFYKEAPEEISRPDRTKGDTHNQTLARLDWELEQRKRLAAKCREAEKQKEVMLKDIKKQKEYLEALAPCLTAILQVATPVQDQLGVQSEMKRQQNRMATYLPTPLFILYVQSTAYAEAWGEKMDVDVDGDVDEATALKESIEEQDEDSGDSDQEELVGVKRYRRSTTDKLTEARRKILQKHPLCVSIVLSVKDGSKLKLSFYYLVALHVITVKTELALASEMITPSCDVLSLSILLDDLFPDDFGHTTPNQANYYQLKRLGMDNFATYVSEIGRPYLWAQRLGGLDFVQAQGTKESPLNVARAKSPSDISCSHMEMVIRAVKERLNARIALQKLLWDFEQGIVSVPPESLKLFPAKIATHLTSWSSLAWDDYQAFPQASRLVDNGLVSDKHFVFVANFERGSAKLTALVAVSLHYPLEPAVFALSSLWKAAKTSLIDSALWDMEQEVNVHWRELAEGSEPPHHCLLANQLQCLAMCFDVYLETEATEGVVEGPHEFAKEKMFFQQSRGRSRSKPFKYDSKLCLFTHR